MSTISKADRSRLTIPGIQDGRNYLVQEQAGGWWIQPEPEIKPRREWRGPKRDLAEHLQALADAGLTIERGENSKVKVPPCRF